jgi:hypothetical protein
MVQGSGQAWAAFLGALRLCVLFVSLFCCVPCRVEADDTESQARALFERGVAASDQGHWAEAAELYQRSRALVERPSTLFNLVGVLHRLGRYREGLEVGAAYLRAPGTAGERDKRAEVERLLADMQLAVGVVEVSVLPRAAQLTLDGVPVPASPERYELAVDPGQHVLTAFARSYEPQERRFAMERGVRVRVELTLVPDAPEAAPPKAVLAADEAAPAPLGKSPLTKRQRRLRRALWVTGGILVFGGLGAIMIAGAAKDDDKPEPTGGTTGITLPL